jgi:hypothetical protein
MPFQSLHQVKRKSIASVSGDFSWISLYGGYVNLVKCSILKLFQGKQIATIPFQSLHQVKCKSIASVSGNFSGLTLLESGKC